MNYELITIYHLTDDPRVYPNDRFVKRPSEKFEACIARTGGAARMGNTKARRSIAAASRTEQTDLQLRTPHSLKFHPTPLLFLSCSPSHLLTFLLAPLFVSGYILPTIFT
jgi:hypothetical protein